METRDRSGRLKERNSPSEFKLKEACKMDPVLFLPEANTIKDLPPSSVIEGKTHKNGVPGRSDNPQPSRFTAAVAELVILIQSENSPSSSRKPVWLSARNSAMNTSDRAPK